MYIFRLINIYHCCALLICYNKDEIEFLAPKLKIILTLKVLL